MSSRTLKLGRCTYLSQGAITTPVADLLCVGGISILVMVVIASISLWNYATGNPSQDEINFIDLFVLQTLINWPHFVVSYKLLYAKRENLKSYPMATLGVPGILLLVCLTSLFYGVNADVSAYVVNQQMAYVLWLIAALYLAWHYTGQTWGMIATFSHLSGLKLRLWERHVLRNGLRVLIFWHVIWGVETLPKNALTAPLQADYMMPLANVLAICAFVAGLYVFGRIWARKGRIDARVLAPWFAVYMWYFVLFLEPGAYMFVQLSHALQYMIFPARVELNAMRERNPDNPQLTPTKIGKLLTYYLITIIGGLAIFYLPDLLIGNTGGLMTIGGMLALAVNIHHYYTDSAIWKLQNREVRQQLFSHLPQLEASR